MRHQSFTLIELLSVIGIIAVLAGILLGGLNYAARRADEAKTIAIMEEFATALETFRQDHGFYPVFSGEVDFNDTKWELFLNKGPNKPNRKNKPYLEGDTSNTILDSFGNPLYYMCPGNNNEQKYDLWSTGPDGQQGDKKGGTLSEAGKGDDICNWKKR